MFMNSRPLLTLLSVFSLFFAFGAGYVLGQSPQAPIALFGASSAAPDGTNELFAPFWEVWDLVHTRYYAQPVDDEALMGGAIEGMLATLDDPHTRYLSPEDQANTSERMNGEFQGIGAEVESVDGNITIVSPIVNSPAEAAGLLPGDILRAANGVDLTGMDLLEAVSLVRGPAGTAVTLLIERNGEQFEVEITRDVVELASVSSRMLDEGLAYIRLTQFGYRSVEEMNTALTELMAQNPSGLILDLRRNPGGGLDTVVEIADQFLNDGVVLEEEFGNGRIQTYESTDKGLAEEIPMVVLIDEGSASASEVLAGAIRDRNRGILIGNTSYGKGTVQTWHTLSNNGGVRITIARWLTPDENWVNEKGLEPDYLITLPEVENPEDFTDTQLQAAIDYLLGNPIVSETPSDNSS
ncbi:MAG: S41 family peptidase [Ardenticatenaceae bacterium]|nr:S41 family peptidase [Ardenticatenaceae bacterium]